MHDSNCESIGIGQSRRCRRRYRAAMLQPKLLHDISTGDAAAFAFAMCGVHDELLPGGFVRDAGWNTVMSLVNFQVTVELAQIICGNCGGTYAIADRVRTHKHEHGESWHCPYCQIGWGFNKSQLVIEQERHQATLSRLNDALAAQAVLERKLKRVDKGVCPHCNRSFQNLARHMEHKHKTTVK